VHGVYVTGALWDDVVHRLSTDHRCIAPTWPFGAHRTPVDKAVDLGVVACGRRVAGLLDALDLSDVTLVANDTGGGIVLSALGDSMLDWDRVSRLVFTNCDSFEHFPPAGFAPLVRLCRFNAVLGAVALRLLATGPGQGKFVSMVTRHGIEKTRRPALFGGFATSSVVRRNAVRFTAGLDPRYTLAATDAIKAWTKPVLIAWSDSDKLFPIARARRLAETFPRAELRIIPDGSTYVMLDKPDETASAINAFVKDTL
jgi:pimeloyl-ACP methyl ester carboxylesterase